MNNKTKECLPCTNEIACQNFELIQLIQDFIENARYGHNCGYIMDVFQVEQYTHRGDNSRVHEAIERIKYALIYNPPRGKRGNEAQVDSV